VYQIKATKCSLPGPYRIQRIGAVSEPCLSTRWAIGPCRLIPLSRLVPQFAPLDPIILSPSDVAALDGAELLKHQTRADINKSRLCAAILDALRFFAFRVCVGSGTLNLPSTFLEIFALLASDAEKGISRKFKAEIQVCNAVISMLHVLRYTTIISCLQSARPSSCQAAPG